MDDAPTDPAQGRDETDLERSDRNLDELMQEVRVVQTGIQILFGFLLTVAFQPKFATLSSFQKADYVGTLVMAATTLILLTAPSSWHRILFRRGDKTHLVRVANRFTMTGQATMGLTVIGVVMLLSDIAFRPGVTVLVTAITVMASATAWYIMPLARRRQLERPRVTETRSPREPRSKRQPGAA